MSMWNLPICFGYCTFHWTWLCFMVWMSKPVNQPVLWAISQVVTSDKSYRLNCSGSKKLSVCRVWDIQNTLLPGKCLTSKWVDMWRRWSDNQNGPLYLSLHRWQTNTLWKEYFWRHELIPSTLFHFPALWDHMLSCKVLVYVCFCVRTSLCLRVAHYCVAILNSIKTCRGKWLGLNYSNEHSDQSLLFYFHPPTKFISLCWNTQRKPHIG